MVSAVYCGCPVSENKVVLKSLFFSHNRMSKQTQYTRPLATTLQQILNPIRAQASSSKTHWEGNNRREDNKASKTKHLNSDLKSSLLYNFCLYEHSKWKTFRWHLHNSSDIDSSCRIFWHT